MRRISEHLDVREQVTRNGTLRSRDTASGPCTAVPVGLLYDCGLRPVGWLGRNEDLLAQTVRELLQAAIQDLRHQVRDDLPVHMDLGPLGRR